MILLDGVKLSIGIRLVRVDGNLNSGENAVYLLQHFCPEPNPEYVPVSGGPPITNSPRSPYRSA